MTGHTCFELCTESLGFESGNCSVGEGEEELHVLPSTSKNEEEGNLVRGKRKGIQRKNQNQFPPPLRWMSTKHGKQSWYMKSERKDGRLILTEVRIERPQVFQVGTSNPDHLSLHTKTEIFYHILYI